MRLSDIKNGIDGLQKVASWLDSIGETDQACRAEVLEHCKADKEARAYYVSRYEERAA